MLAATWTVESDVSVEGFEWGEVSFRCSHSLSWNYNKYLCKDPCTDNGHKLATVVPGGRAEAGRITLVDSGDGVFTVTFTQLQTSDSGIYWCGVDRPLVDTYEKVYLLVKDGKCTVVLVSAGLICIYWVCRHPSSDWLLCFFLSLCTNTYHIVESRTTVIPQFSSAWTYQNLSTAAEPITQMDSSANISKGKRKGSANHYFQRSIRATDLIVHFL